MESNHSRSALDVIPGFWFEPVVGLWTVLVAAFGMQMTVHFGGQVLRPLGVAPWAAIAVTALVTVVAYGVFGIGATQLYRASRAFEPRAPYRSVDAVPWRWVAGLVAGGIALMSLGGLWVEHSLVAATPIGFDLPAYPEGIGGLVLGIGGVNEMVNQAPLVVFAAALAGVVMGPAVGAVFHGILQDTLARVVPPAVTIGGTALAATVIAGHRSVASPTTVVVFGFVLGVAYAYRETEHLGLVLVAYGLFNAIALLLAWGDILASLYLAGHLVG